MFLRMNPYEWHHWYLGTFIKYVGFLMMFLGFFWWGILVVHIGQRIRDDDFYQHTRQLGEPGYHSPLHYVFGKYLYKYRFVQWLTKKLDSIFQKFGG